VQTADPAIEHRRSALSLRRQAPRRDPPSHQARKPARDDPCPAAHRRSQRHRRSGRGTAGQGRDRTEFPVAVDQAPRRRSWRAHRWRFTDAQVVGEFIYAAIAAGITGLVSPSCALCSRPRTLFHSYCDGERICTSCYSRLRTATCAECGREDQRITASTDDGPICRRCYQKARPRETCAECGRRRVLTRSRDDGLGYCRGCRARRASSETCAGCGQDRRVNARTDDGNALCPSCYARTRTSDDVCDECGTIGPLAARAGGRRDASRNLCVRCYRHPRRPCGICGRLKRIALKATATSPDVCPTCYQAPVIDCSLCGRQALGRRTTNGGLPRCFACQAAGQIDAALTSPDGSIRPELMPVRAALTELERPRSLLNNWHSPASRVRLTRRRQHRHRDLLGRARRGLLEYLRRQPPIDIARPGRTVAPDQHATTSSGAIPSLQSSDPADAIITFDVITGRRHRADSLVRQGYQRTPLRGSEAARGQGKRALAYIRCISRTLDVRPLGWT
jgi:hypothetical protein